ncbi:hypothetical protein ACWIYZ_10010 [Ursidibacter arcticus]
MDKSNKKIDVVKELKKEIGKLRASLESCPYGQALDEYSFITDPKSDLTDEIREQMLDRWTEKHYAVLEQSRGDVDQ